MDEPNRIKLSLEATAPSLEQLTVNPHFSQAFYCGVAYRHVYGVALSRALLAKWRIHARIHRRSRRTERSAG